MPKIGERVGTILGREDDDSISFLGYGVYTKDEVPQQAVGWIADACKQSNTENPRIELDNGDIVYGCECWWSGEEVVKEMLKGAKKVNNVNINDIRKEWNDNKKKEIRNNLRKKRTKR